MVTKQITLQAIQETRSPSTGAISNKWVDVCNIWAQVNPITTTHTTKEIRVYSTKTIVLTKYKNITPESNRLLIDGVPYKIYIASYGVWTVLNCEVFDVC
jgi:SPP1 family predicted phage head-tail adaptor